MIRRKLSVFLRHHYVRCSYLTMRGIFGIFLADSEASSLKQFELEVFGEA